MWLVELFYNYTFRTVIIGSSAVGFAAGGIGCFAYLRRQSMISDVISHSSLLGVMGSFLLLSAVFDIDGRNMLGLIIGSLIASGLAAFLSQHIAKTSKLGQDAAMAMMIALFFGGGLMVLGIIMSQPLKGKGGLMSYMFGNASTLTSADVKTILVFAVAIVGILLAFWKEFQISTFDTHFGDASGFPSKIIDPIIMATIVLATVLGIKSVGLILMVAFVVMPPAAARQWTNKLGIMVILASIFGGLSGAAGAIISITIGRIPTGPVIVIVLAGVFIISMIAPPKRSVIYRAIERSKNRKALLKEIGA